LLLDLSLDFFCRSKGIDIKELQNDKTLFGNLQKMFSNENISQKIMCKKFQEAIDYLKETTKCMAENKAHSVYVKENIEKIIQSHPLLKEINNYLLALECLELKTTFSNNQLC
jgi:Asp-tRNA(Asn)/Glu-tRNA(Gln) amidotransferase B subunit